jgi:hypothetical protein
VYRESVAGAATPNGPDAREQETPMKTKLMTSDASNTIEMALHIMQNGKTSADDRARCAAIIRRVVREAEEILKRVAKHKNDEKNALAAAEWLKGGR